MKFLEEIIFHYVRICTQNGHHNVNAPRGIINKSNSNEIENLWIRIESNQLICIDTSIIAHSHEEQDFGSMGFHYGWEHTSNKITCCTMNYPLPSLLIVNLYLVWLTCAVFSPGRGCGSVAPPGAVWCPAARLSVSGISSSAAAVTRCTSSLSACRSVS